MSIRVRMVLAFALAATLPLAVAGWLWRLRLEPAVDAMRADRLERTRAFLVSTLDGRARELRDRVEAAAAALAADTAASRALVQDPAAVEGALALLRARHRLERLVVLDGTGGTVLADAEGFRRRVGADSLGPAPISGTAWSHDGRDARVSAGARLDDFLVAGSAVLDEVLLGRLEAETGAAVALQESPPAPVASAADARLVPVPLAGEDGGPVGWVVASVDLSREGDLARELARDTLLAALVGLLVSGLLGAWLAGRVTGPMRRLSRAMHGVATGEMDLTLPAGRQDPGRMSEAFNRMVGALASSRREALAGERRAAWREAARRVAHEVKNPLTPIRGAVENLRRARARGDGSLEETFEVETATVLEEVERLRRLVDEFSRFAKMPRPRMRETDLPALVAEAARRSIPETGEVSLELELDDVPKVSCDPDQVAGAVANLVRNGVDAMGDRGGGVGVRVGRGEGDDRGFVDVVVRDEGPGIPPEDREKIFRPYFTTKRRRGGTGLGLAIARQTARDHGGTLTLADNGGSGASFRLRLPLRQEPGEGRGDS